MAQETTLAGVGTDAHQARCLGARPRAAGLGAAAGPPGPAGPAGPDGAGRAVEPAGRPGPWRLQHD